VRPEELSRHPGRPERSGRFEGVLADDLSDPDGAVTVKQTEAHQANLRLVYSWTRLTSMDRCPNTPSPKQFNTATQCEEQSSPGFIVELGRCNPK
jgi:hypothetical protein